MQRTFNYTDRVRLRQQDVRFSFRPEGRGWSFAAVFELDGYDLPGESLVFVEAYRQRTWMGWPWGTVVVLCQPLHTPGDLVEQLASRQELVTNRAFLAAATTLYVDPQTQQPKRGSGKSRGTARRLADFCNQIDVTWDLYALEPGELLAELPKEFQRFQPTA